MGKKKNKRIGYPYRSRTGKSGKAVGALVVGSVGASVIGSALPGTAGAPVKAVGTGFANFVGPAVTVMGAGMVVRQLRKLPRPPKKRMRRR